MKSFYAELLDNMGVKIEKQEVKHEAVPPTIIREHEYHDPMLQVPEVETFEFTADDGKKIELAEGHQKVDAKSKKNLHLVEEPTRVIPEVITRPAHFVDEEAPQKLTSSSGTPCRPRLRPTDGNTFSSYEINFYNGFTHMDDVQSIEFALADEDLTECAGGMAFLDGHLAKDYPLAVRFKRTEFGNTRANKEMPFVVMVAENDYGARVCRVFLDLKRIATAGGYSADQLIPVQTSLYRGKVGQKDGQLHAWPTAERVGIVVNGKISADKVRVVCNDIAAAFPHLADLMKDVYNDAVTAEAAGHLLSKEYLTVLPALYAEVKSK